MVRKPLGLRNVWRDAVDWVVDENYTIERALSKTQEYHNYALTDYEMEVAIMMVESRLNKQLK